MRTRKVRFGAQGWAGFLSPSCDTPEMQRLLADPSQFARLPGARQVIASQNRHVWRVEVPLSGMPTPFYVKWFANRAFWHKLGELFFGSRALNSWRVAHALAAAGLPCPDHVAAVERQQWGFIREAYLVTREVKDAEPFRERLARLDPDRHEDRAERRALFRSLGRLIRDCHRAGFYHADLKIKNILVSRERSPGPTDDGPAIWLLDTDRSKKPGLLTALARAVFICLDLRKLLLSVKGSVRRGILSVSLTDVMRFFDAYCEDHIRPGWRRRAYLWAIRAVPKSTTRKRARDRRHRETKRRLAADPPGRTPRSGH